VKTVVVTGAAKGIGLGITRQLVEQGDRVVAVDLDAEALDDLRAVVGDQVVALVGDIANMKTHEAARDAAVAAGGLHGWVNNAGIDWVGAAHEVTAEHVQRGLEILQIGPMLGGAVAVRHMRRHGGGSIVNISSIQGVASFPRYYVYGAAKAALLMATRSIAIDYAHEGIRCNVILPGCIETPMTYSTLPKNLQREDALEIEGRLAPMGRVGQPHEIATMVAFLLSDDASYVNGAQIAIDGGATARCFAYPTLDL
jgi:NAD(P)-dependent dehydrogenase (short-subunit alcohol dehydrogenase family)